MNQTDKATPRPWKIEVLLTAQTIVIADDQGIEITSFDLTDKNRILSALIVQAVNQFDALKTVAEAAKFALSLGQVVGGAKLELQLALKQLTP